MSRLDVRVVAVVSLCAVLACRAELTGDEPPAARESVVEDDRGDDTGEERPSDPEIEDLLRRTARGGTVVVRVEVDAGVVAVGLLDTRERAAQERGIQRVQRAVLAGLDPDVADGAWRWRTLPLLGIQADHATLLDLVADPRVVAIRESPADTMDLLQVMPIIDAEYDPPAIDRYTGAGYAVAVVDDGVDATHEFYSGRVVAEACRTAHVVASCDDGAGIIGGAPPDSADGPGTAQPPPVEFVDFDHGTHMAGIAAGWLPEPNGLVHHGVAPDADLVAIRIAGYSGAGCLEEPGCRLQNSSDAIAAFEAVLDLAQDRRIVAVNYSGGHGPFAGYCDADERDWTRIIGHLRSVGVLTVATTGNDGWEDGIKSPACVEDALAVGWYANNGSDPDAGIHLISTDSSTGAALDLVAPGSTVTSSARGGYITAYGTSEAAPQVAGAVAVLKDAVPKAGPADIEAALLASEIIAVDPDGGYDAPLLQLGHAVEWLQDRADTFGEQRYPAVDLDGGLKWMTWTETRDDPGPGVWMTSAGAAATQTLVRQVPEPRAVGKSDVAGLSARTVVVWEEGDNSTADWRVMAQIHASDGSVTVPAFPVGLVGGFHQEFNPAVTKLDAQHWLVVWESWTGEHYVYDLEGRIYDIDGTPITDRFLIAEADPDARVAHSVPSVDGDAGWALVAWDVYRGPAAGGGQVDVFARKVVFDPADPLPEDAFQVNAEDTGDPADVNGPRFYPSVGVFENSWVVAWDDDRDDDNFHDIWFVATDRLGETVIAETRAHDPAGNQRRPAVATSGDEIGIAWWDDLGNTMNSEVAIRFFDLDGTPLDEPRLPYPYLHGRQWRPALAASPYAFHLVWEDDADRDGWTRVAYRGANPDWFATGPKFVGP